MKATKHVVPETHEGDVRLCYTKTTGTGEDPEELSYRSALRGAIF